MPRTGATVCQPSGLGCLRFVRVISAVPSGLEVGWTVVPTLKGWAILTWPSGPGRRETGRVAATERVRHAWIVRS